MKICTKCKIEKTKPEFSKDALKKDGLQSRCRACVAARDAAHYAANKEKIKEQKAKYYASNKEKVSAQQAEYQKANTEKEKARKAKYRKADPEKFAARNRTRRAIKRNAEGTHTKSDVRAIFAAQRGLCANCLCKLFKSGKQKFHVDHIMPLALGGSNWPSNLQCLCPACNLSKGAKHPFTWAAEHGRLL